MDTESFTTEEHAHDTSGSLRVMWRLLQEVPLLKKLIVPNVIFAAVLAAALQGFLWGVGTFAECGGDPRCSEIAITADIKLPISIETLIWLATVIFVLRAVQWIGFECGGQIGIQPLLRKMVHGVSRVRTSFFDQYPSGKIINRLVQDSDHVRVYAPIRIGDASSALVELVVVAVVISCASPIAGLVALPAFLIFISIQRNIAPMLQKLQVLRSARFGEVLHRESDIIEGVRCFELYGDLKALLARFSQTVYRYVQMHILRGQIEAWGRFWSDVTVGVYGAIILIAVYVGLHYGGLSATMAVVIVTVSFRLSGLFGWLTWSLGLMFETAGIARRVLEYVDLPAEETEEGTITRAAASVGRGGTDGDLSFVNYTMSYRQSTVPVLVDLSLRIVRGSKVGLVGRTGAGKTSIVQSLFRMVYVRGGDIRIGDQSLLAMPIDEARAFFAIVPQDPYLFEGTVRSNLDRYNEYDDATLLQALRSVHLSVGLGLELHEGGSNLSLGQRQLLCLARVVLSKKPFVIMDEPTSGVDTITDAIMQSVLRTALADRTVVTIAHRLETLARMDRIIELQGGAIVRDGAPSEILPSLSEAELG